MTYTYSSSGGEDLDGNKYDSSITPSIKPENLQDKECGLGVGMKRSATKPESAPQAVKVGGYYYWSTGGPGPCGNDADDKLKGDILTDFSEDNLEAL